ncbi:MAG: hypothetical protein IKY18_00730 [Oscillospiraceae bacterium]|nr:hypothetical protein [Oscillospiraceae bacterium]
MKKLRRAAEEGDGECGFDLHFLSLWAKENKGVDAGSNPPPFSSPNKKHHQTDGVFAWQGWPK